MTLQPGELPKRWNVTKLIESLRDDLTALYRVGSIDKVTMRDFDALCAAPDRSSFETPEHPGG